MDAAVVTTPRFASLALAQGGSDAGGPAPYWASYAAAKGGLIAFSHSLRAELRGSGVSASVVCPGFVSGAGMFAERERTQGLRAPAAIGTVRASEVADAVVRAVCEDVAEILISPGPARLMQVFNQLAQDAFVWLLERTGAAKLLRGMALPANGTPAQQRAS
jgi:short-subunit dehydrogenase